MAVSLNNSLPPVSKIDVPILGAVRVLFVNVCVAISVGIAVVSTFVASILPFTVLRIRFNSPFRLSAVSISPLENVCDLVIVPIDIALNTKKVPVGICRDLDKQKGSS